MKSHKIIRLIQSLCFIFGMNIQASDQTYRIGTLPGLDVPYVDITIKKRNEGPDPF